MTLAGLRVLNPRPATVAATWTRPLRAEGAVVVELPLLAYADLPLDAAARQALIDLDQCAACLFVSREAAVRGLAAVADWWPQWPQGVAVIAVGEATAAPLRDAGLDVIVPVRADSDGLLDLPQLAADQVRGRRLLLFRGSTGRELLRQTLQQRGGRIDLIALYQCRLPAGAAQAWAACQQQALPQVVLLSSLQIWRHWQQVAGALAAVPVLVVSSERLATVVRAAGAAHVVVTEGAAWPQWRQAVHAAAALIAQRSESSCPGQ